MRNQTQLDDESNSQTPNDSGVRRFAESTAQAGSERQLTLRSLDWNRSDDDAVLTCVVDEPVHLEDSVFQFQLSLRADQLAQLCAREPSLNPSNVFAWSARKGRWVAALTVPQVAEQVAKARIDRVRLWSMLCASRVSASAPPPRRPQLPARSLPAFDQEPNDQERPSALRSLSLHASTVTVELDHPSRFEYAIVELARRIRKSFATFANDFGLWRRRLIRRVRSKAYSAALIAFVSVCTSAAVALVDRIMKKAIKYAHLRS